MNLYETLKMQEVEAPTVPEEKTPAEGGEEKTPAEEGEEGSSTPEESPVTDKPYKG